MSKKKRNTKKLTLPRMPEEKEDALHQVGYEKAMLDFAMEKLRQKPTGLEYAVLMESFLIHARILNDFFYGLDMELKNEKILMEDDMIVEDFLENDEWIKPEANRLSRDLIKKINKQLTHLTYNRIPGRYGDWDFEDIHKCISELIDLFFQKVNIEQKN